MKFKYEQGLIPAKEINISSGLESIIDSNLEAIELQDYKFAFESCMIDTFEITKGMEADEDKPETSEAKEAWYIRLWKWIKDMFTKLGSYLVAGFRWLKRIFFKDEVTPLIQPAKMEDFMFTIEYVNMTDAKDKVHEEVEKEASEFKDNVKDYYTYLFNKAKEKLNTAKGFRGSSEVEKNKIAKSIAKAISTKGETLKVEVYILNDDIEKRIKEIPEKELDHFNSLMPILDFSRMFTERYAVAHSPAFALVDINANIYTITRVILGGLPNFDYEDMRKEMDKSRHAFAGKHKDTEIDFSKQLDFCKKHVEFLKSAQGKDISIFKKIAFEFSYNTSGKIMEKSKNDFKRAYGSTAIFISELNSYFNSMEKDITTVSKAVNSLDINKLVKEDNLQTGEAENIFRQTKELFKITFEASQLIMKIFKNSLKDIKRASDKIDEVW